MALEASVEECVRSLTDDDGVRSQAEQIFKMDFALFKCRR